VLLCAALAGAQAASPTRQLETGREWLARCGSLEQASGSDPRADDGGQTPPQDCLGWVEGLLDINEIYRGLGALEKTGEGFCTPLTATATDAARAVARYFRDHPDALHFSARILAYMALRQAFPCERRTP
jgi:hypothetical protein